MEIPLAIIHHANQYLITEGYDNREGLAEILGDERGGLWRVMLSHSELRVPVNLHVSGTLLEAIAWRHPSFIRGLRQMLEEGWIEVVGSCYAQNIMRFFSYDYNLRQLNEELELYKIHLGIDPQQVKVFWPPERVWDTEKTAPVLTDQRLLNGGYRFVILDDRLILPAQDENGERPREQYDNGKYWDPRLFQLYRIAKSNGLVALPISHNLRHSIPPRDPKQLERVESQLEWLHSLPADQFENRLLAIYADDMEKVAGVGEWDERGPAQFEHFLRWVKSHDYVRAVKISEWITDARIAGTREIQIGGFAELANHFQAGDDYEKWFFDPRFRPYRACFSWADARVRQLAAQGADPSLIELAEKHLLVSNWETAWHDTPGGYETDRSGEPSPWIRALASQSRHAAVIAEAAHWMSNHDGRAHAHEFDLENDGQKEIILKNQKLFAVITPRWGGRLVSLFDIDGERGKMMIGNPSDDWNWQQEPFKFMEQPRNHPGALADVRFENDRYDCQILHAGGELARVRLTNVQAESAARGLVKEITLAAGSHTLEVKYTLPPGLMQIEIEFGLSADYLHLLRYGRYAMSDFERDFARGVRTGDSVVWVEPQRLPHLHWTQAVQREFGHGHSLQLTSAERQFTVRIGAAEIPAQPEELADAALRFAETFTNEPVPESHLPPPPQFPPNEPEHPSR